MVLRPSYSTVNLTRGLPNSGFLCRNKGMSSRSIGLYRNHRFPPEIIAHAVWLYHRFSLSFREVEELLAERGVIVSYEAVRLWCLKFGQAFAKKLRHRRSQPGDTWHLDEMFIRIRGERYYLWRAVDQDGQTLDILVQKRRNTHAAKRFFRKLLKGLQYVPNRLVTDKLRSYRLSGPPFPPSSTAPRSMPIIAPKSPTNPHGSGNATCAGLSLCDTSNSFFRFTAPSIISFGWGGIL